jgi:DNA-binding MarR family transcriptional regulator
VVHASRRDAARPDDLALAESLFATIGLLRRQARQGAGRPWPLEPLAGSQLEVIRLIRRQPGTSVAEAAAELGLAANTVSTLVGQLTEAGLLRRTPDAADRRVARLTLTGTARRHIEAWRERRSALAAVALGELTEDERATLADALPVLAKIADSLRQKPPAATDGSP